MKRLSLSLIAAFAAAGCALTPAAGLAQPVVEAPAGSLRGETTDGVNIFRGLPYALPPTGWRRWRPPAERSTESDCLSEP